MKHIKKFNESEVKKVQLTRIYEVENEEKIDEGLKEWILAGALALASAGGAKAQKSNILNQPKSIEYSKQDSKDTAISVDFGTEFESGTYRFSKDKAKESELKLNQITEFVKKFNGRDIKITIEGSESQVPNIDKETGKRLPKGGLAKMRVAEVQDLINSHIDSLIGKGIFKGTYDTTTTVGPTTYKLGEDPGQEKFTKEQYVRVTVKVGGEIKGKEAFAAYSKRGERIFTPVPYGGGGRAIGDIFYRTKATTNITDAGNIDTGHEDVILKTLNKESVMAETKKEYDGHMYLIPSYWLNSVSTSASWPINKVQGVKDHLEVNPLTGKYLDEEGAINWLKSEGVPDKYLP